MDLSQALERLAADRDDRCLGEVFAHMAPAIRRLATRLTGDAQLGEECVAETVLAAGRAATSWRPRSCDLEGDARRWVLGIAATTALAMSRSRRRARERDARAGRRELVDSLAPEAPLIDDERSAIVRGALAALPGVYGAAVAARYVDGLDVQQASARLGVPEATVKTRTFRGLSLLRRRLEGLRAALSLALWPLLAPRGGGQRPAVLRGVARGGSLATAVVVTAAMAATGPDITATRPARAAGAAAAASAAPAHRGATFAMARCWISSGDAGDPHQRRVDAGGVTRITATVTVPIPLAR
jgi:RNA polymerase sigma-70 factor (ECF subfamily)